MFDNLKKKFAKRVFGNQTVVNAAGIIEDFLDNESFKEQYASARYFNKHGDKAKQEFRKHMMDIILKLIEDDKPIYALRKEILKSTKCSIRNRLFFDDQFVDKRDVLYEALNTKSPEASYTDEICAQMYMWSDAECCVLRMFQIGYFERSYYETLTQKEDDWYDAYCKLFESNTRQLYSLILEEKEGKEHVISVENVLFKHISPALDQMEKVWIGEKEWPKEEPENL